MAAGARARAGARERGRQAADQRPRIVHARRQLHPRRGAGAARLLRRLRLQRLRHRGRRRRRPALAEWIAAGEPPIDLWPVDIRRFGAPHGDDGWVRARTLELYGKHYTIAWPGEEHSSGRPLRRSPLYDRLRDAGAVFGEKLGWERANWFARPGTRRAARRLRLRPAELVRGGRRGAPRLPRAGRAVRCQLVREVPAGRAGTPSAALSWICANDVAQPPGTRGLHADAERAGRHRVRPHRHAPRRRRLLHRHRHRLRDPRFQLDPRNLPDGADARLLDVTSAFAVLPLMGPRARDLLRAGDRGRRLERGPAVRQPGARSRSPARRCARCASPTSASSASSCTSPTEYALAVYDALVEAGRPLGLAHAGYRAIEIAAAGEGLSRLGRRHRPRPHAARGGPRLRASSSAATQPFLGREALERQRATGLKKRLAGFTVDDPEVVLLGRETIYRDGERVGWLTSGGYRLHRRQGDRLRLRPQSPRASTPPSCASGRYELEVATERVPATLHLRPLYDPSGQRIRQ